MPYPMCARRLVRPRRQCSQECQLERRCGDRWLVRLSSDLRKVRELPELSSLHLLLFVFELSSAPSLDETEYSTEGVGMRPGTLLEVTRPPAGDLIHSWKDLRIVELAFGEEAEQSVHEVSREGLAHFLPGFGAGLSLEAQVSAEHCRQCSDLISRPKRFRTCQQVTAGLVPFGRQRHSGDRSNVVGIDRRDRRIGKRRPDHVACAYLRRPSERIGHEAARSQDRPRHSGRSHRVFRSHPHADYGIARISSHYRTGGKKHDLLHTGPTNPSQHLGHVLVSTEQEYAADAQERGGQRLWPIEIADDRLHARRQDALGLIPNQSARPLIGAHQLPDEFTADVTCGARYQDHLILLCQPST